MVNIMSKSHETLSLYFLEGEFSFVVPLHNNKSYRGNKRFLSLFCFVFSVKYFDCFD